MRSGLAVLPLLVLAACGTETADGDDPAPADISAGPVDEPTAVPAADGEVTTTGPVTVLDDGGGAELCLGGVAESLPPQCGGPGLVGWDWADHVGDFESAAGTRWGEFVVTGSFDGTDLTPTDVMPADEYDAPDPSDEPSFATPCPEPEGGWVVDAQQVSRVDLDAAFRVAGELPGYAGSFVDEQRDAGDRQAPIDPHGSSSIVNVSVTDDPAVAEEAIREVWGGGLCITAARYPDAELGRIQDAVNDLPGMTSSSRGDDRVDVSVVYDDGTIQAWVDEEYGDGVVVVSSALAPVD